MTATLVDVQAALITKLKSDADLVSALKDQKEIREIEWVGSVFSYPNIRVRVVSFERDDPDCDRFNVVASVIVFGENASSKLTNVIAGKIYNLLDRKQLQNNVVKSVSRIRAVQMGANYVPESGLWQSEVNLRFQVS